jgi:dTDP-4-dehydrorhamnose reductase
MKRILLFGRTGQIGWELHRSLQPLGELIAPYREEADFERPENLRDLVRKLQPHVIVNAAAYTAVDAAETNRSLAEQVNTRAPAILAEEAKRLGALLVHFSSDYVFDGAARQPYTEEDEPNPLNVYGLTKITGDRAIESVGCNHIIFRTSWVYSWRRDNFLRKIVSFAEKQKELKVVNDQFGAPTSARLVAQITACCLDRLANRQENGDSRNGVFNLTASGVTSRFGFARAIIDELRTKDTNSSIEHRLVPISSRIFPSVALRPRNSQLDCNKIIKAFDLTLPEWQIDSKLTVARLLQRQVIRPDRWKSGSRGDISCA